MQSESYTDLASVSNCETNEDSPQASTEVCMKRKRPRGPATKKWSKKEEERILKYALKLSEQEYLNQVQKTNIESKQPLISEIEPCKVVHAKDEDFEDVIGFFESLWSEDTSSTGIIKIIPPEKWVKKQREEMNSTFLPRFRESTKKIVTRKQTLNNLYQANVS